MPEGGLSVPAMLGAQIEQLRIQLGHAVDQALVVLVAGDRKIFRQDVQALIVKISDVLVVVLLGLRVGLRHRDQLQKSRAIRIRIVIALGDEIPEAVHHALAEIVPPVRQEAVAVIVLGGKIPGRETAAARNPHGRMRLLNRPRPDIDHRQFEVLAVPRENLRRRPRLDNQVVRLVVALALLDRRNSVAQVHVLRGPERHAGNHPPAADTIDHRILFGDSNRRIRSRQRRPICTTATSVPLVARARIDPIKSGFGMKP